LNLHKQHVGF